MREHKSVSRAEYEQMVGVSTRTAKNDLQMLIARGFIKRVGRARATRYRGP
ncbi:MAG: hypothetical protein ACREOH_22200 [Candidatus Entotheonellia bacterium]